MLAICVFALPATNSLMGRKQRRNEDIYMGRHGENIRKRTDGRWEGRYKPKDSLKYKSIYANSYTEVKKKLVDAICVQDSARLSGMFPETDCFKQELGKIASEWLDEVKNNRKYSTYIKYMEIYNNFLKNELDNFPLNEINEDTLQMLILTAESESIRKSIFCVINQVFLFAAKNNQIECIKLKYSGTFNKYQRLEIFNISEQEKLIDRLGKDTNLYKKAVTLCFYSGLRIGEVCALKKTDIDLKNRIIFVNSTVQRIRSDTKDKKGKTVLMVTEPKSKYSMREIPIAEALVYMLEDLICSEGEFLFGGKKPMEPRTLQYNFKKIQQEAGISEKNFHALRHTFATNCIEQGVDVKSLSEILGHSNVQITLNKYVHPTMETKRRYMEELASSCGQIRGQTDETEKFCQHFIK